jgi:hypothetical protein
MLGIRDILVGADPDADPDPRTRTSDPKIYGFRSGFGTLVHLHHSSKIKRNKEVTKQ